MRKLLTRVVLRNGRVSGCNYKEAMRVSKQRIDAVGAFDSVVDRCQSLAYCVFDKFGQAFDVKFRHYPPTGGIYRLNAYIEKQCNFLRRFASGQMFQDREFSVGQPCG